MSPRRLRRYFWFFLLTGFGLCGLAGYAYFAPLPGPAVEAAEYDFEISDCGPGQQRRVELRLHNHSGHPVRVLGLALC